MEECGMGAAVEQLTARGKYQSPRWGAIDDGGINDDKSKVSIPEMGGNRGTCELK